MPKSMKIATWNLDRPRRGGWKKNPIIQEQIDEINADIWILTETNRVINICLSSDWAKRVNQVTTWQCFTPDGKPVSDHQGVYVDLF